MNGGADRRAHYRVQLPPGYVMAVVNAAANPIDAEVFDMSFGGAGVIVRGKAAAALSVGDIIGIEFTGPVELRDGIRLSGIVRHISERDDGGRSLGLQFENPVAVRNLMPEELRGLLNRRKALRVEPASGQRIEVQIKPSRPAPGVTAARGTLLDISATGIGVCVNGATAKMFASVPVLQLTFALPGCPGLVAVVGSVRCRVPMASGERIGLFFEGHGTRDWLRYERMITQYIFRRQVETRHSK